MHESATSQTIVLKEKVDDIYPRIIILASLTVFFIYAAWWGFDYPTLYRVLAIVISAPLASICILESAKIIRARYHIMTLSPEGFTDTNIAPEIVPWAAVEDMKISSTSFRGRERLIAVEVKIKDSAWNALTLSRSAKLIKYQTGAMWIGRSVSETDFRAFFETPRSYARAHGGKVE
ncbi:hypothetical protein [Neomesorhizobium albiziae]|nr:hypothetical protein [Mesorhizobium albiziae]